MSPDARRVLQRIVDIAIPVLVALFLASLMESRTDLAPEWRALGALAGLAQGAALWWRRSHPEVVLVIALAGGAAVQLLAPDAVFPYAALISLASLAARRGPRVSLPALAAVLAVTSLDYITATRDDATFAMLVAVVPWALGEARRNRRAAISEAALRAAGEEQARIARELHDVLAHSVSVIVVQAAAADDVFDEHPDQARTALRSIEGVGREALGELKRVLAGVNTGGEGEAQPSAGLARLDQLVGPLRAAGLAVELRHEGASSAPRLSKDVDLSAYRIVQEALTNTLRHASATHVEVTVRTGSGVLELEVNDDGHGPGEAEHPAGRGIRGMRERAAMVGGTLEAGRRPDGGFRVLARLPVGVGA